MDLFMINFTEGRYVIVCKQCGTMFMLGSSGGFCCCPQCNDMGVSPVYDFPLDYLSEIKELTASEI